MKRFILIMVLSVFSSMAFAEIDSAQSNEENFEEYGPVHDSFEQPKDDGGAAELNDQIADAREDFHETVPEPSVKQSALAGVEHHKVASSGATKHKKATHKAKKVKTVAHRHSKTKNSKVTHHKAKKHPSVAKHGKKKATRVAKKSKPHRTVASVGSEKNSSLR